MTGPRTVERRVPAHVVTGALTFERFRCRLEDARRRGLPFDRAWEVAMRATRFEGAFRGALEKRWDRDALLETREEWRAAYECRPTRTAERMRALCGEAIGRGLVDAEPMLVAA